MSSARSFSQHGCKLLCARLLSLGGISPTSVLLTLATRDRSSLHDGPPRTNIPLDGPANIHGHPMSCGMSPGLHKFSQVPDSQTTSPPPTGLSTLGDFLTAASRFPQQRRGHKHFAEFSTGFAFSMAPYFTAMSSLPPTVCSTSKHNSGVTSSMDGFKNNEPAHTHPCVSLHGLYYKQCSNNFLQCSFKYNKWLVFSTIGA
eukprot:Gb_18776 [translate_table: standard]